MENLESLNGLGEKSAKVLRQCGIKTKKELEELGPIKAFLLLEENAAAKPSLNFLYALAGALQGKSPVEIARTEKESLLMELEAFRKQLKQEQPLERGE